MVVENGAYKDEDNTRTTHLNSIWNASQLKVVWRFNARDLERMMRSI